MIKFSKKLSDEITKDHIPDFIKNILVPGKVYLAGGSIRCCFNDDEVVDYDLFFNSMEAATLTKLHFENLEDCKVVFVCPVGKLVTFKYKNYKIQVIKEDYYPTIETLLNTFDITACRHGYDGENVYSFYSSIRDSVNMKLNFHTIQFPMATMKRVQKYIKKGFTLTNKGVESFINIIYYRGQRNLPIDSRFYID